MEAVGELHYANAYLTGKGQSDFTQKSSCIEGF